MAGHPPPTAKVQTPNPRPQTRSQSRIPQPTPSSSPSQRDAVVRQEQTPSAKKDSTIQAAESTSAAPAPAPHLPHSTYRMIADSIRQIIEKFNPTDQPRLALTELFTLATKAAEIEMSGQSLLEKTAGLEDKKTDKIIRAVRKVGRTLRIHGRGTKREAHNGLKHDLPA